MDKKEKEMRNNKGYDIETCPFCGEKPKFIIQQVVWFEAEIICTNKSCHINPKIALTIPNWDWAEKYKQRLIKEWNKRNGKYKRIRI